MQHQTAAWGNFEAIALDLNFIPTYLTLPEGLFVLCAKTHTYTHRTLHHHFTHDGTQPVNSSYGAVLSVAIISGRPNWPRMSPDSALWGLYEERIPASSTYFPSCFLLCPQTSNDTAPSVQYDTAGRDQISSQRILKHSPVMASRPLI